MSDDFDDVPGMTFGVRLLLVAVLPVTLVFGILVGVLGTLVVQAVTR